MNVQEYLLENKGILNHENKELLQRSRKIFEEFNLVIRQTQQIIHHSRQIIHDTRHSNEVMMNYCKDKESRGVCYKMTDQKSKEQKDIWVVYKQQA